MTRKFSRNYSLSVVLPFIAILIALVALAALAQTPAAGQRPAQHAVVSAQQDTDAAQTVKGWVLPASADAESIPVGRTYRQHGVRPMDLIPPSFLPPVSYDSGGAYTSALAVADLNGDGKSDVVLASFYCFGTYHPCISVLLGNGDGTFQPAVIYPIPDAGPAYSVAVADVNGDGNLDVIVPDLAYGTVHVFFGNGDGTLQPAVTYGSGGTDPMSIAVADVNGDGKPDLVVSNENYNAGPGSVGVLLGNGDGTFQAAVTYSSGGYSADGVAVADVNGDGIPDVVVGNAQSGSVGVLLGNGDGTFQTAVTYSSGGTANTESVAVADLNGDGKPDLAVANGTYAGVTVAVLLGNGDGTFQAAVGYSPGGVYPISVAIGDVNGDGYPDLVVANSVSDSVGVLLGNGDGTFQAPVVFNSGGHVTQAVVVADVNGDGKLDLLTASFCVTGDESCDGNGPDGPLGVLLNNSQYTPIPSTITLTSFPNPSTFGQVVTLTASVSGEAGTATGTVEFFDGNLNLGTATLSSGSASFPTCCLPAGSDSIIAKYQGDGRYFSSVSAPLTQIVDQATTTTSLVSSPNPARIHQSVTYTATVTSQYGGAATGTVTFQDGGVTVATVPVAHYQAAYTTSYPKPGVQAMVAIYSGDANGGGSTSPVLQQHIQRGVTTETVLATSGSPSQVGQAVTFTATVTPAKGTIPDGELVTFYIKKTVLGSVALSGGQAAYTTSTLSVGKHIIMAVYPGDSTFSPSSGRVTQVVEK